MLNVVGASEAPLIFSIVLMGHVYMGYKLNIHNGHLCSKTHCVEMTYGLVLRVRTG